jgi:hypothetical protein
MAVTAHRFPALRPWHSGFLVMVVGAVAVFAGLVQTTVSHGGNENCPSGTTLVAKFGILGSALRLRRDGHRPARLRGARRSPECSVGSPSADPDERELSERA